MISYKRAQEVRHAFERQYKTDGPDAVKAFTLIELRETLAHYAGRDEGAMFKVLIQQRIDELVKAANRRHESHVRAWSMLYGALITIAVGLVIRIIWVRYFSQ